MGKSLTKAQSDAIRVLHGAGFTDGHISSALRIGKGVVEHWRDARSLPAAPPYRPKVDYGSVEALYKAGNCDGDIAELLKIDRSSVCRWRQSKGLPPRLQGVALSSEQRTTARRMLKLGASKDQVAEAIKCNRMTIQRMRRRMPDTGLRSPGVSNDSLRRRVLGDRSFMQRIAAAIGTTIPEEQRQDAILDLYADALAGLVLPENIEAAAASYRNRAMSMCGSRYGPRSIDEEIADGLSLGDLIEDPSALEAFNDNSEDEYADLY